LCFLWVYVGFGDLKELQTLDNCQTNYSQLEKIQVFLYI
jgi:hypothetical protein